MAHGAFDERPFYGQWIEGRWSDGGRRMPVVNKYDGSVIAYVGEASRDDVRRAVRSARASFREHRLSPYERFQILSKASALLRERKEDVGRVLCREAGKPIRDALGEVDRAVQTLLLSAEEAKRIAGEGVPVEAAPGSEGNLAFTVRMPIGVVCAITPFNFPLNLVAHKVGPALAAGNTVVVKPAQATPLSALTLCQILVEAGLPPTHVQVVIGSGGTVGNWLLEEPDIAMYTFTGSVAVGEHIKRASGLRKVTLELGNNGPNIVCDDADLHAAADVLARRAFAFAGQVCISVQNIYVQETVYEPFTERLVAVTKGLRVGDPEDPATDVGPMISEAEAQRAEAWVKEAVDAGAVLLAGGGRRGSILEPTILARVSPDMQVVCREVFAPVVNVLPFRDLDEVIERVNESGYGLQAGVFTRSLRAAMTLAHRLEVGGVIINDSSSYRVDLMPYGGVKQSGIGREGPRYAIEEMTEPKLIVFHRPFA